MTRNHHYPRSDWDRALAMRLRRMLRKLPIDHTRISVRYHPLGHESPVGVQLCNLETCEDYNIELAIRHLADAVYRQAKQECEPRDDSHAKRSR